VPSAHFMCCSCPHEPARPACVLDKHWSHIRPQVPFKACVHSYPLSKLTPRYACVSQACTIFCLKDWPRVLLRKSLRLALAHHVSSKPAHFTTVAFYSPGLVSSPTLAGHLMQCTAPLPAILHGTLPYCCGTHASCRWVMWWRCQLA